MNTFLTPNSFNFSAASFALSSSTTLIPVKIWISCSFGFNVSILFKTSWIRSVFATETGSTKIGAVTLSPIQLIVSFDKLQSTTTIFALLIKSNLFSRNSGVMKSTIFISLMAVTKSPSLSLIYK